MRPRNRSRSRAILSSPVTLVLAAIALFFLARAAWNIHGKAVESAARLESAQNDLGKLEESQKDLQSTVDRLSTSDGMETEVRDKYHAVLPGESVAVIVDAAPEGVNGTAAASSTEQKTGFWGGLLRAIGL